MVEFRVSFSENRWLVKTYVDGESEEFNSFHDTTRVCNYMEGFLKEHGQ